LGGTGPFLRAFSRNAEKSHTTATSITSAPMHSRGTRKNSINVLRTEDNMGRTSTMLEKLVRILEETIQETAQLKQYL